LRARWRSRWGFVDKSDIPDDERALSVLAAMESGMTLRQACAQGMKVGDTFTMDMPDLRRAVRLWCWLTRNQLPMRRRAFKFKVTHITSAGGLVSVR
jgi:hypothetical protein